MRLSFLLLSLLLLPVDARATTYQMHPDGSGDFPTIQTAIDGALYGDA